jgi:hypothetical protein
MLSFLLFFVFLRNIISKQRLWQEQTTIWSSWQAALVAVFGP